LLEAPPGIGACRLRAVPAHGPKPALRPPPRARRRRVHRIPPHVRDDGQRPSCRDGMAGLVGVIWVCGEEVYIFGWDWTGGITLIYLNKLG
jgi:hypothetical protein